MFRKVLLAAGTRTCVDADKEKDLTKETTLAGSYIYIIMIQTIEVRERYNRGLAHDIAREIATSLDDILFCPRQIIKFFHRRNSCACLQEIYYKLKETTKMTSFCFNCEKAVERKQLSRCENCNICQYCSYDCALAHWPVHKVACEQMGYYKPNKPAKSEDDLEEVD